ncbi:hypothetical protein Cgig2_010197 [Carnegiea gigantea]|uniref:Uncharacterized protein n=1 Tax=Carnegiea gigantea TaxID=171969 RepID=A0A9Q1GX78_9CARY|nr:hypothetical protein Cgig2_010197 [Carnegiea gigantea]
MFPFFCRLLSGNNFNGTTPETFSYLRNLTDLQRELLGTSMGGPIPLSLSLLTNLTILRLNYTVASRRKSDLNTMSMAFPNLMGMTNLQEFSRIFSYCLLQMLWVLRNCLILGHIRGYIQNLSKPKHLDLSFNQLSRQVLDSMRNLKRLEYLDVSYNNLTGCIIVEHYFCKIESTLDLATFGCTEALKPNLKHPDDSLFINCGGHQKSLESHEYEEDSCPGGPSTFFALGQKWAYSSTGSFLYNDFVNFVALDF